MEIAARSRSERWPAKDWTTTVTENMARRLKMEGPAICQIFLDSNHVSLIRLPLSKSSSCSCGHEINRGSSSTCLIFLTDFPKRTPSATWVVFCSAPKKLEWDSTRASCRRFHINTTVLLLIVLKSVRTWESGDFRLR